MSTRSNMFTAQMVAPCGLDCSICIQAHAAVDPCPGCNGSNEDKPAFCSAYCGIVQCKTRRENGWPYCDVCPDYPCKDVMEKENRYTTQYPRRESPLENLKHIIRKHIIFHGAVQGVGFRYRARHAAERFGCTGWVKNEWNGTVSMEIQGEEDAIDQVILAIEAGTYVHITDMEVKNLPAVDAEYGFRTR